MDVTTKLADFIFALRHKKLPVEVYEKAKLHLLDTLGVALAASKSEPVDLIINSFLPDMRVGNSPIWGRGINTSLLNSILVNGVMGHTLELDDVHREAKAHLGTVIIPVALNLGAYLQASGEEILRAIIVGYEVMIRIGIGVGAASHRLRGWHATGTCGTFGAAAAASYLMKLDKEKIANALGLAGTQSAGLWAFIEDGSLSKKLHPGRSAEAGVLAALLARSGFTGPTKIIEAKDGGFFKATSDDYDFSKVIKDLGKEFEMLKTEIKPFACCRSMHPAIEAALNLREKVSLDQIEKIEVRIFSIGKKQCGSIKYPTNSVEAQFSLPYAVAVSLVGGQAFVDQFSKERIKSENIHHLVDLTEIIASTDFDKNYPLKWESEVSIILNNGKKFIKKIDFAKGAPENPLSEEELKKRFYELSKKSLSKQKQEKIVNYIEKLSDLKDINTLVLELR